MRAGSGVARVQASLPAQRQLNREVAVVDRKTAVAIAKVSGVIEVTNEAILGTGLLSMNKRQLELLVPEVSGNLDYIQTTAVIVMSNIIGGMGK